MVAAAHAAARARGLERYGIYIEALARRMAIGKTLAQELADDVDKRAAEPQGDRKPQQASSAS
jgi:hypothetical protein